MRLHRLKVQTEAVQHLADRNRQVGLLVDTGVHTRAVLGADDLAVTVDLCPQALHAVEKFAGLGQDFATADVADLILGLHLRPQSLPVGTEGSRPRPDYSPRS